MHYWRQFPWAARCAVLAVCIVLAWLPGWFAPSSTAGWEERLADPVWRLGASETRERRVVLVDIDEASLRRVGSWPWPRATTAELVNRLASAEVAVQVLDLNFAEPRDGDDVLALALQRARPVVAQVFSLDPAVNPAVGEVIGPLPAAVCPPGVPQSYGHYGLAASLAGAQPLVGHITPKVDGDGVIRQVPALVCHHGRAYPSLALVALWRAAQSSPAVDAGADWAWSSRGAGARLGFPVGLGPTAQLVSPSVPGLAVPVDAAGYLRVPYHTERGAFISISAAEVLRGTVPAELLRGSVVIVGSTAFGLGDRVATPLSAVGSGLEVHAQLLVGMFDQSVPYTPMFWPVGQGLALLTAAGVLLLACGSRRGVPAKRLPILGLGMVMLTLAAFAWALLGAQLWLPCFAILLFCALGSVALATLEHATARAQRERVSAHLGAYLPQAVAVRLMATEPTGDAQFEPVSVTVMVAAVRNFDAFAAGGPPAEVAALLHAYSCLAVDVVERSGGVVESIVGDQITAVWGSATGPVRSPSAAIEAARELVRETAVLFSCGRPVADVGSVQPLALGIGIESGTALVGSFGPARRRAHVALGQPVGIAGRIQQMTADLSVPILLGPQAAGRTPADDLEPLGDYLLENVGRHAALFTVKGWSELVAVDPHWAASTAALPERREESDDWSGWVDTARSTSRRRLDLGPPAALAHPRV